MDIPRAIVVEPWVGETSFETHTFGPRLANYLQWWYVGNTYILGQDKVPDDLENPFVIQICEHQTDIKGCKNHFIARQSTNPLLIFHPEGDYKYFKWKDYIQHGSVISCNYSWRNYIHYFNYWGYDYLNNIWQRKININYAEKLQDKFLCMNGRPDWHRYFTMQKLYDENLLKDGKISFLNRYGNYSNQHHHQVFHKAYEGRGSTSFVDKMIENQTELVLDKTTEQVKKDDRTHDADLFNDTSISLVTETYPDAIRGLFITEKSWRPIAQCHIPIWIAQPYIVQAFRDFGFDMFDDIVDNSYDNITHDLERFDCAIESLKKLLLDIPKLDPAQVIERLKNNQTKYFKMRINEQDIYQLTSPRQSYSADT